ncbi:uncharacterized protein STEHIDRAFT_69036, partial [Stereum hirsutum FP-91666 SS1]
TCATFEVLRNFHTMTLQGKISAFDYYHALALLTDGYGLEPLPVNWLPSFVLMMHQWRNLKMLKRGACGHAESGVEGAQPGELAVQYRPCPILNVNVTPSMLKGLEADRSAASPSMVVWGC